jgi:hypothetical protein
MVFKMMMDQLILQMDWFTSTDIGKEKKKLTDIGLLRFFLDWEMVLFSRYWIM